MATRGVRNAYQGMNWIAPAKRLALYLRDGLACIYCSEGVEQGVVLTLDHLIPYSAGTPDHSATNLITACKRCNSSRGNRSWRKFAAEAAGYLNVDKAIIIVRIKTATKRSYNTAEAKAIMARRGNFSTTLRSLKGKAS